MASCLPGFSGRGRRLVPARILAEAGTVGGDGDHPDSADKELAPGTRRAASPSPEVEEQPAHALLNYRRGAQLKLDGPVVTLAVDIKKDVSYTDWAERNYLAVREFLDSVHDVDWQVDAKSADDLAYLQSQLVQTMELGQACVSGATAPKKGRNHTCRALVEGYAACAQVRRATRACGAAEACALRPHLSTLTSADALLCAQCTLSSAYAELSAALKDVQKRIAALQKEKEKERKLLERNNADLARKCAPRAARALRPDLPRR